MAQLDRRRHPSSHSHWLAPKEGNPRHVFGHTRLDFIPDIEFADKDKLCIRVLST